MYKKRNSFDGEFCLFNSISFKRIFNECKEKKGYTKADLLDEIAEEIGSVDNTISGWLQGKTPVDGKISENGKLNEKAIVVKLAKYFGVDVKELLKFPNKKGEKKMDIVKEQVKAEKEEKYNQIQIKALQHLNDIVMEYMILKCHTMDNYADESNWMEYFDYSNLVDDKFKVYKGIDEKSIKMFHKEKTEKEKEQDKKAEIERIENMIKKDNKIFQGLWKERLENIDKWMLEKQRMEEKDNALKAKYNTDDEGFAEFIDDTCQENSAYGYVLFEIEKVSTLLRKEFLDNLENAMRQLYEIYDNCWMEENYSIEGFATNEEEKVIFKKYTTTDYVKYLFAKEFSLYC